MTFPHHLTSKYLLWWWWWLFNFYLCNFASTPVPTWENSLFEISLHFGLLTISSKRLPKHAYPHTHREQPLRSGTPPQGLLFALPPPLGARPSLPLSS